MNHLGSQAPAHHHSDLDPNVGFSFRQVQKLGQVSGFPPTGFGELPEWHGIPSDRGNSPCVVGVSTQAMDNVFPTPKMFHPHTKRRIGTHSLGGLRRAKGH